tara:strand:- start:1229 stop:1366 length:138 start_codon:yes stop_codon:yes gene_type:complete
VKIAAPVFFRPSDNIMTRELPKHLEHLAPDEVRTDEIIDPKKSQP